MSYFIAQHFTFGPRVPSPLVGRKRLLPPGAENPSYATAENATQRVLIRRRTTELALKEKLYTNQLVKRSLPE